MILGGSGFGSSFFGSGGGGGGGSPPGTPPGIPPATPSLKVVLSTTGGLFSTTVLISFGASFTDVKPASGWTLVTTLAAGGGGGAAAGGGGGVATSVTDSPVSLRLAFTSSTPVMATIKNAIVVHAPIVSKK